MSPSNMMSSLGFLCLQWGTFVARLCALRAGSVGSEGESLIIEVIEKSRPTNYLGGVEESGQEKRPSS